MQGLTALERRRENETIDLYPLSKLTAVYAVMNQVYVSISCSFDFGGEGTICKPHSKNPEPRPEEPEMIREAYLSGL